MRVVHAAALTAAAMLMASIMSAQGLGDAAAREREKRKAAPAKPAKVFTDDNVGGSAPAPTSAEPSETAQAGGATPTGETATGATPTGETATGETATGETPAASGAEEGAEGQQPTAEEKAKSDAEQQQAEEKAKAQAEWRGRLDTARKLEQAYKDVIEKLQLDLNDTTGGFGPGRQSKVAFLEENKQKLAEAQAVVAKIEEEGRRNSYR